MNLFFQIGFFILLIAFIVLIYMYRTLGINYFNMDEDYQRILKEENHKLILIDDIKKKILWSGRKLKEIDHKGSFESDDEIGWFFKNIQEIQKILNLYTTLFIDLNDGKEEK